MDKTATVDDSHRAQPALRGEILVTSHSAAVAEIVEVMARQECPQPDSFAVRVLLTEALSVAKYVGCDARIGERLMLRFSIRHECVKVRLYFCATTPHALAPIRLRRRRRRAFEQLAYLAPFSTMHRIEKHDGSLTIMRDCHRTGLTPQSCSF